VSKKGQIGNRRPNKEEKADYGGQGHVGLGNRSFISFMGGGKGCCLPQITRGDCFSLRRKEQRGLERGNQSDEKVLRDGN